MKIQLWGVPPPGHCHQSALGVPLHPIVRRRSLAARLGPRLPLVTPVMSRAAAVLDTPLVDFALRTPNAANTAPATAAGAETPPCDARGCDGQRLAAERSRRRGVAHTPAGCGLLTGLHLGVKTRPLITSVAHGSAPKGLPPAQVAPK